MPEGDALHRACLCRGDRPAAINRVSQGVHHAPDERVTDRHLRDPARRADLIAFLDVLVVAKYGGADDAFFKVERERHGAVLKFKQLRCHRPLKSLNADNAVAGLDNRADIDGSHR